MLPKVSLQQQDVACKYKAVFQDQHCGAESAQLFILLPREDVQDMPRVMWCFVLADVDKWEAYWGVPIRIKFTLV
jgi:hypothetical protein